MSMSSSPKEGHATDEGIRQPDCSNSDSVISTDSKLLGFPHAKVMSLQDLAKSASLSGLSNPSFETSDFSTLEPRLQELLFDKLRKEILRLQMEERSAAYLKRYFPYADQGLYYGKQRLINYMNEDEHSSAEDGVLDSEANNRRPLTPPPNPYEMQTAIRTKWSYSKDYYNINSSFDRSIPYWDSMHLYWERPSGDLKLDKTPFEHRDAPDYQHDQDASFERRISSQLLLYRIIVMFGMIPPAMEGYEGRYKSCWECVLAHIDGKSMLSLYDYKGWGSLKFKGTDEGSRDAMELLNFLTGWEIPHSYDGVLAGTIA